MWSLATNTGFTSIEEHEQSTHSTINVIHTTKTAEPTLILAGGCPPENAC